MQKMILLFATMVLIVILSGCATITGGKVSDYQKTKPTSSEKRKLRPVPFTVQLLICLPCLGVDFLTGAIYRPEDN